MPTRASRTFAGLLQYKPRFTFCDPECHFLQMTFLKTLDDMNVFNFSFLVQRYKSVKKVFKPAGVSRKFLSLLDRQELLQDFYSINQDFNTPRSAMVERNLPFRKFTYSEIDSDSVRKSEEISDRPRANLCICR